MPNLNATHAVFASLLILLARLLLSAPFLYSGVDKLWRWQAAEREVAESGLALPTLLHIVTVFVQLVAGLSVLVGVEARLGAIVLCFFLLPVTVIYHPFWKRNLPALAMEADHFLSNFALIGGLLMIIALGSGAYSVVDHPLDSLIQLLLGQVGVGL